MINAEALIALHHVADALRSNQPDAEKYYNEESWNLNAHVEVTMTVADVRAVFAALRSLSQPEAKPEPTPIKVGDRRIISGDTRKYLNGKVATVKSHWNTSCLWDCAVEGEPEIFGIPPENISQLAPPEQPAPAADDGASGDAAGGVGA